MFPLNKNVKNGIARSQQDFFKPNEHLRAPVCLLGPNSCSELSSRSIGLIALLI